MSPPTSSPRVESRWADLGPRAGSAVVMILLGTAAVVAGGVWFRMLAVFVTAVMIWELWTMVEPKGPTRGMLLAALVASVMSGAFELDGFWRLALFLLAPILGAMVAARGRATFFAFALAIQVAGWGLVSLRDDYGFWGLIWLISVVVVTDVLGYFAGRLIGGPKFWPRVSPKKTWSGTVAGWLGAAVVGLIFMAATGAGAGLLLLSVLLSLASQWGDIAESALKRSMGVKDSSALIPGHGGLFDRFDALLGASIFMLVLSALVGLPEGLGHVIGPRPEAGAAP